MSDDKPPMVLDLRRDPFADVGDFHAKFGQPVSKAGVGTPRLLTPKEAAFRTGFLDEELAELKRHQAEGNLPEVVDALCDLIWVALGTLHFHGADFWAHWAEVRRANMAKERPSGPDDPRLKNRAADKRPADHQLDILKPEDWTPPDHEAVLREKGWLL